MKTMQALLVAVALSAGLISSTGANATLMPALGGQVVNDTDLNITWLANANLAASNTFGVSGINTNGSMNWSTAQSWIVAMNINNYLGFNDWRLPIVTDTGTPGCNFAFSGTDCGYNVDTATGEMSHLFYYELDNKSYFRTDGTSPQPGWGLVKTGPFTNLQPYTSWTGMESAPNSGFAWTFSFLHGGQGYDPTTYNNVFALAVRPGQVPEPATTLLLGIGLLGLIGVARHKAA